MKQGRFEFPDTTEGICFLRGALSFCLDRLFADETHHLGDEVVQGLSFEELIGALLQGRDLAEKEEGS
jgi:hypothetical protein